MANFKCTYRDKQGVLKKQIIAAYDKEVIIKDLREKQFFPISVEEVAQKPESTLRFLLLPKNKEISNFTRQLSNLLLSGLDLAKALNLLVEHTNTPRIKVVIRDVRDDVINGILFSDALSKFPKLFSSFYTSMVRAGESGEKLEQVLEHLADHLENRRETKNALVSTMVYPAVLLVVGFLTIIFIMGFVFPRMSFIFNSLENAEVPWITTVVMLFSNLLIQYGWILIIFGIVGVLALMRLMANKEFRYRCDKFLCRVPIFGDLLQKMVFVRFTQMLGLVLSNGLSMVDALDVTIGVIQNVYMKEQMEAARFRVVQGQNLAESLKRVNVFSPIMVNILAVSEETATLEENLPKVSLSYEREIQEQLKQFVNLLEPALILILAFFVGVIVLAILLPIFQMNLQIL